MANEHAIGFMDSGWRVDCRQASFKQLPRETVYFIGDQRVCHTVRDQLNKCELFFDGGFLNGKADQNARDSL